MLDVGCGGGAAGLALVPPASRVDGVDQSPGMLAAFAEAASDRRVAHATVCGSWPEVAGELETYDVVVCHHVAYNVAELAPFARVLGEHARNRVVLELTATHPWADIGPLWRAVHHQDRPIGPTAELAHDVLAEAGIAATLEWSSRPRAPRPREIVVEMTRRRLCLPADRDGEIDALLPREAEPGPRRVATLWWDAG